MNNFLEKITKERVCGILMAGFAVSLVPILILSFYNYPCADDFSAGDTAYWAWNETGSLIPVLKAAIENVIYNYREWSGVFASVFWTSLQPAVFGEKYYAVTTWITVFLILMAGYYFFYVLFLKYGGADRYETGILATLFLFTMVQSMPSGLEGLYWHPGVVNYTWAHCFLLLLAALVLSGYKETGKKKRYLKIALSLVMAVLVGGGNYITALQGCLWLSLIAVLVFLYERNLHRGRIREMAKKAMGIFLPLAVLFVSFGISILAPGNKVRMSASSGMGAMEAIFTSFLYVVEVPLTQWLSWPVIVLLAFSLPWMVDVAKKQERYYGSPFIAIIPAFGCVAAGFTPNLYAQGEMVAGRLHNTVFFVWLLMLYLVQYYCVWWWVNKKRRVKKGQKGKETKPGKLRQYYVAGVLLFFLFAATVHGSLNQKIFLGLEAAETLLSGRARRYEEENEARLKLLKDENIKQVVSPRFTDPPSLLLFQDISPDAGEWVNQVMALYYGKESVRSE